MLPASCCARSFSRGKVSKQKSRLRLIAERAVGPEGAEQQVLGHGELGEQPPALGHEADAEIDDLLGRAADQLVLGAVDRRR